MAHLSFDEWVEKYKPLMTEKFEPYGFETYGDSLNFVKSNDPYYVWTLCENSGTLYICAGKWHIDRINYFVCEIPWEFEFDKESEYPDVGIYPVVWLDEEDDIHYYYGC